MSHHCNFDLVIGKRSCHDTRIRDDDRRPTQLFVWTPQLGVLFVVHFDAKISIHGGLMVGRMRGLIRCGGCADNFCAKKRRWAG